MKLLSDKIYPTFIRLICVVLIGATLACTVGATTSASVSPSAIDSAMLPGTPEQSDASSDIGEPNITFPDVKNGDWFAPYVLSLTTAGIINGYPDGLFHPEREITTAEFTKLIITALGSPAPTGVLRLFPMHWASDYITAAYECGIITDADLEAGLVPDEPIIRSAMTKMMVLALGIDPARIDDPFTDISDSYASTAYNEYLLLGYIEPDNTRTYRGNNNAARGEAAAIITRVIEYSTDPYEYKRAAILDNASKNLLTTESELIDLFYIINREFMSEFAFRTNVSKQVLRESYERANVLNLEYFYSSSAAIKISPEGENVITVKYSPSTEEVTRMHTAAEDVAREIVAEIITSDMTDTDKVKALHDYLVQNCEYDFANYTAGSIPLESRLAYGALVDKVAVCQGYCAAFSLLCEYAGVRTIVTAGFAPNSPDDHAWNAVLLDGVVYYLDITHDDPVPDRKGSVSYRYYLLTESEMLSYGYNWDADSTQIKYFY